jgi:hypothetical protein
MSRQKGRRYHSVEKIFDYWDERYKDLGYIGVDKDEWGIVPGECFACGDRGVQRAHIIPRCYGGSDDIDNIHLLCARCHAESEGHRSYWTWLHWKRKNEWKCWDKHLWDKLDKAGFVYDAEKYRSDPKGYIQEALNLI